MSTISGSTNATANEWILLKYTFVRRSDILNITRYSITGRPTTRNRSIFFGVMVKHIQDRIDIYPDDPGYDAIDALIAPAWAEYTVQWRRQESEGTDEQNRRNNMIEHNNTTVAGVTGTCDDDSTDSE